MKTAFKYKTLIIFLAAVLILAAAVLIMVKIFEPEFKDPHEGQVYINDGFGMVWLTPLEGVAVNPFTQADFRIVNGQPNFIGENYTVERGIDVSEHQHEIDWERASSKIDYAYVRLGYRGYTEGGLFEDPFYKANMEGAGANGLKLGVYFFSQAISVEEAIEEAEFVLERVKDYDISLPIVYDWEKIEGAARTEGLDPRVLNDCAIAFCETVKNAGYSPAVYFNRYMGYYMYDLSRLTAYDFWMAVPGDFPDFYYAGDMWQYSFSASVPGIAEPTDMNLRFVPIPGTETEEGSSEDAHSPSPAPSAPAEPEYNTEDLPLIGGSK